MPTDDSILGPERPTERRTRFSFIKLPKTERFVCTRRDIKAVFGTEILRWVGTGTQKLKMYDRGYSPRPKFVGPVVASLDVSHLSDSRPILYLYAVRTDQYSNNAAGEFRSKILPEMKAWLDRELAKPETSKFGHGDDFVTEWSDSEHRIHYLRRR